MNQEVSRTLGTHQALHELAILLSLRSHEDVAFLGVLCPVNLTCGTLAVTAVLGAEGVGSVAAAEAAAVVHVQQQAG